MCVLGVPKDILRWLDRVLLHEVREIRRRTRYIAVLGSSAVDIVNGRRVRHLTYPREFFAHIFPTKRATSSAFACPDDATALNPASGRHLIPERGMTDAARVKAQGIAV